MLFQVCAHTLIVNINRAKRYKALVKWMAIARQDLRKLCLSAICSKVFLSYNR